MIVLAGIPGVGKSTALRRLKETGAMARAVGGRVVFVREPSDLWRDRGWLQKFYADPGRYAAAFQFLAFDSFVEALESAIAASGDALYVCERSMYDHRLFWSVQVDEAHETADSMYNDAYTRQWARWKRFIPEPAHIFFLKTPDLQDTMARVQERAREEETSGLTLDYQEKLLERHREWYRTPTASPPGAPAEGVPCTVVDATPDWRHDDDEIEKLARFIADAIKQ